MAEDVGGVDEALLADLRVALTADDAESVRSLVGPLHPADQAEILRFLPASERQALVHAFGDGLDPELLSYIDEELRPEVARSLGPERTAAALAELESDDAIAFLEDLEDDQQLVVIAALPATERSEVERSLQYPEYTAGRLMQRAFVALPDYWVVGQAIDYLRNHPDLPEDFYDIFLVSPRFEPVASVPLSKVLRSVRSMPLRQLRTKELHVLDARTDQEEVARRFRKYGLVSAPVTADRGRIVGVVTVDDIVEVIEEEAEDDILKLGGISESDVFRPLARTVRKRQPWLVANMVTAILAASVISQFEASIAQIVALAVLMPIVASMGGNCGMQTMTIVVRGLATGEIGPWNGWRVLKKEIVVGLANGATFLAIGGLVALVWFGYPELAVVFGGALFLTLFFAAVIGVLIPLGLQRLDIDPAVASGVFVTTVTDVFGFFVFLGVATVVLL